MLRWTEFFITLFYCGSLVSGQFQNEGEHVFNKVGLRGNDWWQTAVFYQIYPRSFFDSDNDGNGDLTGIRQKLNHIKDMGADAIWLSPIYKSPQVDNGYDISDYRDIDPMYGNLDDLRELINEAHEMNIKVIMDFVPNHTSDEHEWFQASLKRDPKYDDYYVWVNATIVDGERKPPNNWLSSFKGSAWEWNEERQQFYLHQFSIGQPDLNYRNPNVVEDMKDVLRYWLSFGVDGFRMDAVPTLFEDIELRDEPKSGKPDVDPDDYNYLSHIYTMDQPETIDMIYQWRELLDEYNENNGTYTRVMLTEVYSTPEKTMLYYGTPDGSRLGAHFTFNFITFILDTQYNFTSSDLTDSISTWLNNIPEIYTSNWVLGNHDQPRVATRLGVGNIDALNMLAAILPGAQVTYQGEEIGQENGEVKCEEGYDPQAIKNCSTFSSVSRDFERTPFQWDNTTNAGFNNGHKPWLPVSKKYIHTNLAAQNIHGINSHYNIYKDSLKIRKLLRPKYFDEMGFGVYSGNIFYVRRMVDGIIYMLFYNVGDLEELLPGPFCDNCNLTVAVRSINSDYNPGERVDINKPLKPREAILCKVRLVS